MNRRTWMKAVGLNNALMVAPLMTPILGACGNQGSDTLQWTEDVKLPDGRIVTLTRYQEFKGPHEIGTSPNPSDYWFSFKNPDTNQIVRWDNNSQLATLVLMIFNKVPMLLTAPYLRGAPRKFNRPNPPYLLFIYKNAWERVFLADVPIKRLRVNMTYSPEDSRGLIVDSGGKLGVAITENSILMGKPYWIDFSKMKKQTFGKESLGRPIEWLVD